MRKATLDRMKCKGCDSGVRKLQQQFTFGIFWGEAGLRCSSAVRRQNGETEGSSSLLVMKSCCCFLPAWCDDYGLKGNEVTQ